jgi:hypothetical protein
MRPEDDLRLGDRVVLSGHWEFPDGTTGVVAEPTAFQVQLAKSGEWVGHRRTTSGRNGPVTFYYVVFDQPTDDGSGDGPYGGAEIDAASLRRAPVA